MSTATKLCDNCRRWNDVSIFAPVHECMNLELCECEGRHIERMPSIAGEVAAPIDASGPGPCENCGLPKSSHPFRIDPPGCRCTDCILGCSVPKVPA